MFSAEQGPLAPLRRHSAKLSPHQIICRPFPNVITLTVWVNYTHKQMQGSPFGMGKQGALSPGQGQQVGERHDAGPQPKCKEQSGHKLGGRLCPRLPPPAQGVKEATESLQRCWRVGGCRTTGVCFAFLRFSGSVCLGWSKGRGLAPRAAHADAGSAPRCGQ